MLRGVAADLLAPVPPAAPETALAEKLLRLMVDITMAEEAPPSVADAVVMEVVVPVLGPAPAPDSRASTGTRVLDIRLTISHAHTTSLYSTAIRSTEDCQ